MDIKKNIKKITEVFTTWQKAEEKLFLRCIPFHEVDQEDGLYKKVGDIALVPYVRICENNESLAYANVSKDMADIWGVPEKAVWEEAKYNSQDETRYTTLGLEELLGLNRKLHKDISHEMITFPFVVCVTNKDAHFGAANIFCPGVADKICKAFDANSLLIGFTSSHETMVHKNDGNTDPKDIRSALHDMNNMVNKIEVFGDGVLSEHVFKYEEGKFEIIA